MGSYLDRLQAGLRANVSIIVQIELWDKWDMHADDWQRNPWHPAKSVNLTHGNTLLANAYARPQYRDGTSHGQPHDFFLSVAAETSIDSKPSSTLIPIQGNIP